MELFKNWQKMAYEPKNQQEYEVFWNEYLPKEAEIYKYLLENKEETVKELGSNFDTTIAKAGAGIEYLEKDIPNLREVLMVNGIGNNVALVKAFAMIGDLVAEDTGRLSGQGSGSGVSFYDNTNFDVYRMK